MPKLWALIYVPFLKRDVWFHNEMQQAEFAYLLSSTIWFFQFLLKLVNQKTSGAEIPINWL